MMFMTGDIHGDINRLKNIKAFCKIKCTKTTDIFFLLGDVGINYYGDLRDSIRKKLMAEIPVTFVCIRGNHEMRPDTISTYVQKPMFGSLVYYEPEYPNIIWLKDGNEYVIEGKKFLAIGGAYSVDKYYRLQKGYNWFLDEQLTKEEQDEIRSSVSGKTYDYVLTHTCPLSWQPTELFLPFIDQDMVDKTTEIFLEEIKNSINYSEWFFGHFHGDKVDEINKYKMLYKNIITM